MLAKGKIINDCNGTIKLNTEGEYNNPINFTPVLDDFLKEVRQTLTLKKNIDIFTGEPITFDPI